MPDKSIIFLSFIVKIELDYFYQLKAKKISLRFMSRDGYLTLLNLSIGNSLVETSLSLKLMKLRHYLLPGHSLIRFCSMKYSSSSLESKSSTFAKFNLRDTSQ